jgi:hypothetical protein
VVRTLLRAASRESGLHQWSDGPRGAARRQSLEKPKPPLPEIALARVNNFMEVNTKSGGTQHGEKKSSSKSSVPLDKSSSPLVRYFPDSAKHPPISASHNSDPAKHPPIPAKHPPTPAKSKQPTPVKHPPSTANHPSTPAKNPPTPAKLWKSFSSYGERENGAQAGPSSQTEELRPTEELEAFQPLELMSDLVFADIEATILSRPEVARAVNAIFLFVVKNEGRPVKRFGELTSGMVEVVLNFTYEHLYPTI